MTSAPSKKQFYSVQEISKILGVSRGLIYSSLKRGEIPHLSVGARILVPVSWLNQATRPTDVGNDIVDGDDAS